MKGNGKTTGATTRRKTTKRTVKRPAKPPRDIAAELRRIEEARRVAASTGKPVPKLPKNYTPASAVETSLMVGTLQALAFTRGIDVGAKVTRVERATARTAEGTNAPAFTPTRVRAVRAALHVSQPVFAGMLNVSTDTVRSWEQGKATPAGAAVRVLELAESEPTVMQRWIQSRPKAQYHKAV